MKVANRKIANRKVANSLLAALPGKSYQRLLSGLEPVTLNFGDVLYETGKKIRHVYFPGNSLVSLLTVVDGRMALEVGMVGREGMVGIPSRPGNRRFAGSCPGAGSRNGPANEVGALFQGDPEKPAAAT